MEIIAAVTATSAMSLLKLVRMALEELLSFGGHYKFIL
jgi:hypothetical protein